MTLRGNNKKARRKGVGLSLFRSVDMTRPIEIGPGGPVNSPWV